MLKRYTVIATGKEGVPFHLLRTLWMARAIRAFNDAKNAGTWTTVVMQVAGRPMMVYRQNPERRNRNEPRNLFASR